MLRWPSTDTTKTLYIILSPQLSTDTVNTGGVRLILLRAWLSTDSADAMAIAHFQSMS
jgi:hypothetical protein